MTFLNISTQRCSGQAVHVGALKILSLQVVISSSRKCSNDVIVVIAVHTGDLSINT